MKNKNIWWNKPANKISQYLLMLSLALAPTQKSLAQNLSADKLSGQEITLKNELEKFIDQGYKCILSKSEFDRENVIDAEGLITDNEEQQIEKTIEQIKKDKQVKILLITKEGMTRNGSMADFWIALGNCLWIWLSKVDNGILIQLDIKDRKSFIATGYRSETVLTDAECSRICRLWTPFFKKNDMPWGMNAILEWLKKALTVEEVKELTDAEKKENERKSKEEKELFYTILMYILIWWGILGTGWYIFDKKMRYGNMTDEYNKRINKLNKESVALVRAIEQLKDELNKTKTIDISSAIRAKDSFVTHINKAEKINKNIWETNTKSQYTTIEKTWGNFFKAELLSGEKLKWLQENFKNLDKKENEVTTEAKNLDSLQKNFDIIKNMIGNMNTIKDNINSYTSRKDWLKNEWYIFENNTRNIEISKKIALWDLEKITNNSTLFEDKKILLPQLEKELDALENTKNIVITLLRFFNDENKKIKSTYINIKEIEEYDQKIEELKKLIPQNIIDKYSNIKNNLNSTLDEQEIGIKKYNTAYKNKDLEWTHNEYTAILAQKEKIINARKDIEQYILQTKDKKESIPSLINDCNNAVWEAKIRIHPNYRNELNSLENTLKKILISLSTNIYDWISGHKKLEDIKKEANEISRKSKKKYIEEEEERQAKIRAAAVALAAEEAAARRRSEESSNSSTSSSSNFWWWSFWWGGGWDSW